VSKRKTVLDLFAGLGGFSQAFADSDDWEVVTVDIEERFDPDIQADVMDLRPSDLPEADVVLASPPCQYLSPAGNHDKWDMDTKEPVAPESREAVAIFYHAIGLIRSLAPDYYFIENPRLSRIRWFIGEPDEWVTYCQYGKDYQKPTGLWGEFPAMTFKRCQSGDNCHVSNTDTDGTEAIASMNDVSQPERAKVPYELSEAIRDAIEAEYANPSPKQVDLVAATDGA
jgi:hypothetical protein